VLNFINMLCHLTISGFVQGVGYRQFVKKNAIRLGLKGWVKNLDRGRVEALFSGKKETIEKAIEICRQGSFLAEVKDVKVEWVRPQTPKRSDCGQEDKDTDFNSFEIVI